MVLLLSRDAGLDSRTQVTVALITTTARGIRSEVKLSFQDGMREPCIVNLDTLQTIEKRWLKRFQDRLSTEKMREVEAAVQYALGIVFPSGPLPKLPVL